jgi:uncharacterized protein (TIGR02118 family)
MIVLSVLYPKTGESHFDHEYYLRKHIPLVKSRWTSMGLEQIDLLRGNTALDGGTAAYELIGHLTFTSDDHLQKALAAHGSEILGDIPNFTNVHPLAQVNHVIEC